MDGWEKHCRLDLQIENPQSPQKIAEARGERIVNEDPRELGVKVQSVTFLDTGRLKYSLGESVDFTETGKGADHANECWSQPDNYGQWTLGPHADLVFLLDAPIREPVRAVFNVTDVAVNAERPLAGAQVFINGEKLAEWTLGPARTADERVILLPEGLPAGRLLISFHVPEPLSPKKLGWSTWDTRPLGLRLTSFRLEPAGRLKYRLGDVIDFTARRKLCALGGRFAGHRMGATRSVRFVVHRPRIVAQDCLRGAAEIRVACVVHRFRLRGFQGLPYARRSNPS